MPAVNQGQGPLFPCNFPGFTDENSESLGLLRNWRNSVT